MSESLIDHSSHFEARTTGLDRPLPANRALQIRQGLLTAILEQRLLPGTKLGEDEIGAIYSASRTLVRSALQQLAHEDIVVIEKNRGAFVASPSLIEAREVFEARRLIEAAIAERAVAVIQASGLQKLHQHLDLEREADAKGDRHASIRLSGEFHRLLADLADHEVYASFLAKLIARSSLIILLYRSAKVHVCGSDHHSEIVAAIEAGDAVRARTLMVHHLHEIEDELDLAATPKPDLSLVEILSRP